MAIPNKILIGCIGAVLLIGAVVACGVGGIFMLGLTSHFDQTENQGVEFGRTTDQRGCQDEALRRFRAATKAGDVIKRREQVAFLNGCLQTSQTTPNYCDYAPKEDAFLVVRRWARKECEREGFEDDNACMSLMTEVSDVCFGKIKKAN